jgi:hypothetical protein
MEKNLENSMEQRTEQQLIIFHDDPMAQLRFELDSVKKRLGNLQRGLFARHSELAKKYMETAYELEMLKSQICNGQKFIKGTTFESYNNQRNSSNEARGTHTEKVVEFDFAS